MSLFVAVIKNWFINHLRYCETLSNDIAGKSRLKSLCVCSVLAAMPTLYKDCMIDVGKMISDSNIYCIELLHLLESVLAH